VSQSEGGALADEVHGGELRGAPDRLQPRAVPLLLESCLQFWNSVEVVGNRFLTSTGDNEQVAEAGAGGLLDDVLDGRGVDDGQKLLAHCFGRRQEPSAESCGGDDSLARRSHGRHVGRLTAVAEEAEKAVWRSRLLVARAALPPARLAAAADAVTTHVLAGLSGINRIAAYVPIGTEPGSLGLLDALRQRGAMILLPIARTNLGLDWAPYEGPEALTTGRWGLREPPGDRASAGLNSVEAILVPALAVDRRGTRLGRGAGYYDRALATVRATIPVVALLHDGELVARLPADSWDRAVTAAVTPAKGWTSLPLVPHHMS
jgi:5-formyltetrahydrofolate cyclo-ligase